MSDRLQGILETVLGLPYEERFQLWEALDDTLHPPDQGPPERPQLSPEWMAEIQRRSQEIDEGRVKPIPWEEAKRRVDEEFADGT